jgi:adenine C2-methylase RlmN of 23S rRNA A2503 and tRNA A37
MKKFTIIVFTCVGLFYVGSTPIMENKRDDTVVMNTVYIPYKDSDHSGSNGIYNDPRMLVSTEFDVNKVATCVGCHFKCNNCEDK